LVGFQGTGPGEGLDHPGFARGSWFWKGSRAWQRRVSTRLS
jgi:hypothetical protein